MSFFSKGKEIEAVLFSPLEGHLTYEGEPASHANIEVWVAWKNQEGEVHQYQSDETGFFSIPAITAIYKDNPLAQLSVAQTVTVKIKGKEFLIWTAGKSSSHLFGELGGKPIDLTCELTRKEMDTHLEHSLLETKCIWKEFAPIKED